MSIKPLVILLALVALTGCYQSNVQAQYGDVSSDCRDDAEDKHAALGKSQKASSRNAELVTLFSDCMAKRGWQVATPKREDAPGAAGAKPAPQPAPAQQQQQPAAVAPAQQQQPAAVVPPPQQAAQTTSGPAASRTAATPQAISPQPAAANPYIPPPVANSGAAPPIYGRYLPAEQPR